MPYNPSNPSTLTDGRKGKSDTLKAYQGKPDNGLEGFRSGLVWSGLFCFPVVLVCWFSGFFIVLTFWGVSEGR